jgi:electron transfer flavoprotein alpha/beta subunit
MYVPRYIPFQDLEGAFSRHEVLHWSLSDLGFAPQEVGLRGSATQVTRLFIPSGRKKGEIISGPPEKLVHALIKKLEELNSLGAERGARVDG